MKAVVQKVSQASCVIDGKVVGKIEKGLMILLGIHTQDTLEDIDYLVRKITKLRVFEDEQGKLNLDLAQVQGAILSVSQFTLYAETKKGNRPSYTKAAPPNVAIELYERFNKELRKAGFSVETGVFGENMQVTLTNDGPVTIIIDTREETK